MQLIQHVVNNKLVHLNARNSCKAYLPMYVVDMLAVYLACRMCHTRSRHECLQCEQEAGVSYSEQEAGASYSEHCGVSLMRTHLT